MRSRGAALYIFGEMIPVFLLGALIFVLILLMFQALRLTEFVVVHGVDLQTIAEIMLYLSIAFLPAVLPMSLLFAVLLTYGRLSSDSEVVAFKSIGLSLKHMATPAIVLGLLVAFLSAKVSFELGPWGNRQFEVLISQLGQSKAGATIKEGVFSEGFFDLIVYANKVDSKEGKLKDVFIYDERDETLPLTVIAQEGEILQDENNPHKTAGLRLLNGNVHKTSLESYTKVDFKTYDIHLGDPTQKGLRKKSILSLTINELEKIIDHSKDKKSKYWRKVSTEYHKRWALSTACLLFALIGVGFGTTSNRRSGRGGGMVVCLGLIVCYWGLYVTAEGLARKGTVPPGVAIWTTNILFATFTAWSLKKAARA